MYLFLICSRKKEREEIEKQFENVAKGVDSLATHCELKSTKLNEIKELLFTVSEDVNIITETVKHIKDSYIERIIANSKKSEDSKDRLDNVSVSTSFSGNIDCFPIDKCISSPEIVKSGSSNNEEKYTQFETNTTDESIEYIRPVDCGQCEDDNLDVDTPSQKNAFRYNNKSGSDITDTNSHNDKLGLNSAKVDETHEAAHIQTLSKSNDKMCRNDLVSDVKKSVTNKPNIQQQHSDVTDARSQFHSHKRTADNRRRRNTGFSNVDTTNKSTMGIDTTGQPKTMHDWIKHYNQVCEHARYRLRSGTVRRTGVRYVTLVLDISERLRGRKFKVMKEAAVEYVEGVRQVWLETGLEENIGLAVFGGKNLLIHECTSELDLILRSIGPRGSIGEFPLQGHMIIFTDSGSDGNTSYSTSSFSSPLSLAKGGIDLKSLLDNGGITLTLSSTGINVGSSLEDIDLHNHAGVESLVHSVVDLQTKVFYVQIGKNQHNAIVERVVKETSGRIVDTREMQRLVLMTKIMILASRIAPKIMHSSNQSKELIKQQIKEESGSDDPYNDCLDMVLEFANPLSVEKKRCIFEMNLPVGIARVHWDNGDTNIYMQCDETSTYNLRKVDEPRILVDEMIAVGCRVVRGHDWKFGDKDGGVGSLGTVLDVRPEGKVVVRWDSKRTGLYKMGHNGRFEIKVHGAPVRSRSKMNEHRSEYKSPHTSDSESEPESFRPRFRPTRDNATQEPNDYVIPIYSDATVSAIWEYEEGSAWRQYPNDINVKIEKAYQRKKTGKTIIEMDRTTYQIYFQRMIQENPSNKTEKSIRRKD
ncbi:unnamed protein product [Mytilus edulis]|uniref:Uncharacterized protein n=1 Tax=Mytilus edulis TaxID=6550 RepID=A0A8S3TTK0_MYTED|nr:unnamed protein product [Mytilus edulis]